MTPARVSSETTHFAIPVTVPTGKMSTFMVDCPLCKRFFKSYYSANKHVREKHGETLIIPVFKDDKGETTVLPKKRNVLDSVSLQGYQLWLDGLIERLNSTFHPRLPGEIISVG